MRKQYIAFKQQRLPAWQPILTAGSVLPIFFAIGLMFVPTGIGLIYFSSEVEEKIVDYTSCTRIIKEDNLYVNTKIQCAEYIQQNHTTPCMCHVAFKLENDLQGNVFMYYGISNLYQNHRRYVKSVDNFQLLGILSNTPSSECYPFDYNNKGIPYLPCGAIANSLFNDVLTLKKIIEHNANITQDVKLLRTGIAWESDKTNKFRNPPGDIKAAFKKFAKPKNWIKELWELDPDDPNNNGLQNEDLIVWMRTSSLPTFRKLYRRVDHKQANFTTGMPRGSYELFIEYNYNVKAFDGIKRMILSTTTFTGGKNNFLGCAYIVVGCVCLIIGFLMVYIHVKVSKGTSQDLMVHLAMD